MQTILVILALLAALGYIGWQVYKRFFAKNAKCDGCAVSQLKDV